MPETFDPRALQGGPGCVEKLRELDIRVSQRLGARIHALGRRAIQFSLALLEGATPGTPLEAWLLDGGWSSAASGADVEALLGRHGGDVGWVEEDGLVKVVAADEMETRAPHAAAPPVAPAPPAPDVGDASSLLPAVLGSTPRFAPGGGGGLWDRGRLEQAALAFLDSEDLTELIEQLRYLFRAALLSGLDPVPLLVSAIRRAKPALALEVAALVRGHLHRDFGRALEDVLATDDARLRDGIHFLLERREALGGSSLQLLILPVLTAVLPRPRALRQMLGLLPMAVPLVTGEAEVVEEFLDAIFGQFDDLEAPERFALSRFLLAVGEGWPWLADFLYRRMGSRAVPHEQAYFGNVLSRMPLDDSGKERCARHLVEALLRHPNDLGLQERLKGTFMNLGGHPLTLLMEPSRLARMNPAQKAWLLDLWSAFLAGGLDHPPPAGLAAFALDEVAARNRGALLSLIRTGLLRHEAIYAWLHENEWLRGAALHVLLEEVLHLEEPDDAHLISFLASLGLEALQGAFERAREEAALASRSAPWRFRVFAFMAAQVRLDPHERPVLFGMIEEVLGFPFARRATLPAIVEAWGALGQTEALSVELMADLLDRILPERPGEVLRAIDPFFRFAALRVRAVLGLYENPAADRDVRDRIEERFEQVLSEEEPVRDLLQAILDGLEALLDRQEPPLRVERVAVLLARLVLRKSRETSLDHVLSDMLRDDAEGVGVRVPSAWGKEDRDRALQILGRVASHAGVSEGLHRMMTSRLAGFLDDWLDAQESGVNLYMYRDTPLWGVLLNLVRVRPSEHSIEAVVRMGLRAIETQRNAPQNMALERREDVQRLLAELTWLAPQEPVEVRGSMRLDIPRTAFQTLLNLAARDNATALLVLEEMAQRPRLPARFEGQLHAFLTFQRRALGGAT